MRPAALTGGNNLRMKRNTARYRRSYPRAQRHLLERLKRGTDFPATLGIASWWSWRESSPRPLECHADMKAKIIETLYVKKTMGTAALLWAPANGHQRPVAHQPTYCQQAAKASTARLPTADLSGMVTAKDNHSGSTIPYLCHWLFTSRCTSGSLHLTGTVLPSAS